MFRVIGWTAAGSLTDSISWQLEAIVDRALTRLPIMNCSYRSRHFTHESTASTPAKVVCRVPLFLTEESSTCSYSVKLR